MPSKSITHFYILFVGTSLVFLSACFQPKTKVPIAQLKNGEQVTYITKWNTFGPVLPNTFQDQPYPELLSRSNDHNTLSLKEVNWVQEHPQKGVNMNTVEHYLNFSKISTKHADTLGYYCAQSIIQSPTDTTVIAIIDGSRNYDVWINNHPTLQVLGKCSNIRNADRFIPVRLNKGDNQIVIKVNAGNVNQSWKLLLGFTNETNATELYQSNYRTEFVESTIFTDTLRLYLGSIRRATLNITNPITNRLLQEYKLTRTSNGYVNLPINFTTQGMLNCTLFFHTDTLQMAVFRGDINQYRKKLTKQIEQAPIPQMLQNDLEVALQRVQFVNNLPFINSASEQQYRTKNLVHWSQAVNNMLQHYQKTGKQLSPNTSLRTYKSAHDFQQFIFHASAKTLAKRDVPLVLIIPYMLNEDTLIKSWYVGLLTQIEADAQLADKYGFAVAWLFMRGSNYSRMFACLDAKGVISRLKEELPITNNIFLLGDCLGAKRSIELASDQKGLYKGLALFSPATTSIDSYDVKQLKDLPIYIDHGIHDQEAPISNTYLFVEEARQQGAIITLHKSIASHHRLERDYRSLGFHFLYNLLHKARVSTSKKQTVIVNQKLAD